MHISYNGTYEFGHRLGDTIAFAYAARLMAQNELNGPRITLSLNRNHPLNFVFDKFIEDFNVTPIVSSEFAYRSPYQAFDSIRRERQVEGKPYGAYKELYRRIDGPNRQLSLCGEVRPLLPEHNIFHYLVRGQEGCPAEITGATSFGPWAFNFPRGTIVPRKSVFISPHEHSQGNRVFTEDFWRQVIDLLLAAGLNVTVCSNSMQWPDPLPKGLTLFWARDYPHLFNVIASQRLVLSGNTGTAWVAAATGVPMIIGEGEVAFHGWSFSRCALPNLLNLITEPDPIQFAKAALAAI